jgi:hypothetical protein
MQKVYIVILLCTVFKNTEAQVIYKNSEYGFGLGATNYYGDINQSQRFDFVQYCGNVFFKHNFNPYISLKSTLSYGRIGGDDRFSSNAFQKLRNLSFQNDLVEIAAHSEFNFLHYEPGDFEHRWTPYINIGIGALYHNPYAFLNGNKYYLKPLSTEGQSLPQYKNRKYSNYTFSLPVGMGFKFWMRGRMTAGLEVGYRFTNTDYLDDVSTTYIGDDKFPDSDPSNPYPTPAKLLQDRSVQLGGEKLGFEGRQRGISSTKDQFMFVQLFLSFRLADYACPD